MKRAAYVVLVLVLSLHVDLASASSARSHMNCVRSVVSVDARRKQVLWDLYVPPGVTKIMLDGAGSFPVAIPPEQLWKIRTGGAQFHGNTLELATTGERRVQLVMDVHRNRTVPDRTYAPFFRFSDGTIAVLSANFSVSKSSPVSLCVRYRAAPRDYVIGDGHAEQRVLSPPDSFRGYVAFGTPVIAKSGGLMVVVDRASPPWLRQAVMQSLQRIAQFYSARQGLATLPTVFIFSRNDDEAHNAVHGDTLPGSISLQFSGNEWRQPGPHAVEQAIGVAAHEFFHVWNGGSRPDADSPETLLALEGSAEFARIAALSHLHNQGEQIVLDGVSRALNRCIAELPNHIPVASVLAVRPGSVPYDCGMPFMLAVTSAAGHMGRKPISAFFAAWRRVLSSPSDLPYRWQTLLPANAPTRLREDLERAIAQPDAFLTTLGAVLHSEGYALVPERNLSPDARWMLGARLMASLMAADCNGGISFWTRRPTGFELSKPLPQCGSLRPGAMLTAILGEHPWVDPITLSQRVHETCAAQHHVIVEYVGDPVPARVDCAHGVPILSGPVRIDITPEDLGRE